jgi:hypothetical protein
MAGRRSNERDRCRRFRASQPQHREDEATVKRSHGEEKAIDKKSSDMTPGQTSYMRKASGRLFRDNSSDDAGSPKAGVPPFLSTAIA